MAIIGPIADPRASVQVQRVPEAQVKQRTWGLQARCDPTVTFEEYQYWAAIERQEELENNRRYIEGRGPLTLGKLLKNRFSKGIHYEEAEKAKKGEKAAAAAAAAGAAGGDEPLAITEAPADKDAAVDSDPEKKGAANTAASSSAPSSIRTTEAEWKTAARALRTASWGTIFYLITTDVLGWTSCPYVFSSVGWGLGVSLYTIFGLAAFASGWMIWKVFLGLDSSRYPMLSFGDTYFRVYGPTWRHCINAFQALQQFMTVAVLVLANGQYIAQLSHRTICFIACMIIAMAIGMVLGSIRSLQRLGWLCNLSVWVNVTAFLIVMIACANFGIDYEVVLNSTLIKSIESVKTFGGVPPDVYQQAAYGTAATLNGVNNLVYSFGGALLFVAFLAEMRHPMDFWKGMLCAQVFITVVYIFFGGFVYGHFGQYSASNIAQVILPKSLQTAGNVLSMLTAFFACFLYFNIGMKTVYIEVCQEILHMPEITSPRGRYLWYGLGPLYWLLAFVVAAAVPNLNGIASLVGALMILNFTYTFPALLYVGYRCQIDARLPGEGFDPTTGVTTRLDGGLRRWRRGFMRHWCVNAVNTVYFLGGLTCCGLGTWAAVVSLIKVFGPGGTVATSFGCATPV